MTFGFGLLTLGVVWLLAGARNQTVIEVLEGVLKGNDGSGPGEKGFASFDIGGGGTGASLGGESGGGASLGEVIKGKTQAQRIAMLKKLIDVIPGLSIGEGPGFGGAAPGVHTPTSYHYKGLAYDINADSSSKGELATLKYVFHLLPKLFPGEIAELFFDPIGYYYDEGKKVTGAIGGHSDHLHVSFYPPKAK